MRSEFDKPAAKAQRAAVFDSDTAGKISGFLPGGPDQPARTIFLLNGIQLTGPPATRPADARQRAGQSGKAAERNSMAGPRQPVDVLKAKGKKHLSKAEEAQRRDMEVKVDAPASVTPPKWLAKKFHKEFLEIGQILLNAGLYKELDRDVLAQYFVCREQWLKAHNEASKAIKEKDDKLAQSWVSIQGTYFKQARQCAAAMGLDVTSRCRLIVPDDLKQAGEDDNPFLTLIKGGRAANG